MRTWRTENNVDPLFNNAKRYNPGHVRPVSLTLAVGKIMERFLKDRINPYLGEKGIIRGCQHGFGQGNKQVFKLPCQPLYLSVLIPIPWIWTVAFCNLANSSACVDAS